MDEANKNMPSKNTDVSVHWGDTVKDIRARVQAVLAGGKQDESDTSALHEILVILDIAEGTDNRRHSRNRDGSFQRNPDGTIQRNPDGALRDPKRDGDPDGTFSDPQARR